MKVLLDENVPHRLRPLLTGHECETVKYRGWSSVRNGELLALAADAGFDAFVTKDTNLPYQQDVANLPLAVVVLKAPTNRFVDIRPLLPALLKALEVLAPNAVTVVP